jgi:hypothetical protein
MSDKPSRERISMAAILLRNSGYPDVCAYLMAKDKKESHRTNKGKRKVMLAKYNGKAGTVWIDSELLKDK